MLNTDLHNHSITESKKMKLPEFIANNRGIDDGNDLPPEYLSGLYNRVLRDEIKMDDSDMFESEVSSQPTSPRFVRCAVSHQSFPSSSYYQVLTFMAPTKAGWLDKMNDTPLALKKWKKKVSSRGSGSTVTVCSCVFSPSPHSSSPLHPLFHGSGS